VSFRDLGTVRVERFIDSSIELMIMHECVNVVVTKDPRIEFELEDDLDGRKYTLDEADVPDSLASVSHLDDGWLLLRFDPPQ
jgi:hypothetical protein